MPDTPTTEMVRLADTELWTARTGHGPALIWCHGGPGLWDYLAPVGAMTQDQTTVYRYDQRGCGRSAGGGPATVAQSIADLEALRVHWGIERWIVAGHSWGATLALGYSLAFPERTTALVYLCGTGISPDWHSAYRAERDRRLGERGIREQQELSERWKREGTLVAEHAYCEVAWQTDFASLTRGRELARQLLIGDLRINVEVNVSLGADASRFAEAETLRNQLPKLDIPALVIHGDRDPRPAWAAREVADLLPKSQWALLKEVGHLPWLERPGRLEAVWSRAGGDRQNKGEPFRAHRKG